jgi:hypothetical protein
VEGLAVPIRDHEPLLQAGHATDVEVSTGAIKMMAALAASASRPPQPGS